MLPRLKDHGFDVSSKRVFSLVEIDIMIRTFECPQSGQTRDAAAYNCDLFGLHYVKKTHLFSFVKKVGWKVQIERNLSSTKDR
jgi:hypothetical protein